MFQHIPPSPSFLPSSPPGLFIQSSWHTLGVTVHVPTAYNHIPLPGLYTAGTVRFQKAPWWAGPTVRGEGYQRVKWRVPTVLVRLSLSSKQCPARLSFLRLPHPDRRVCRPSTLSQRPTICFDILAA